MKRLFLLASKCDLNNGATIHLHEASSSNDKKATKSDVENPNHAPSLQLPIEFCNSSTKNRDLQLPNVWHVDLFLHEEDAKKTQEA